MKNKEIWFIVGTQDLYGPAVLKTVEQRAKEMAKFYDKQKAIPCKFVFKAMVLTEEVCTKIMKEANYNDKCIGIVTWCHTFSPSKMWINGLKILQKPWCHLATQHHLVVPDKEIDMDFMNLNQASHGDREHGFIGARLRLPRKIISGHWKDAEVIKSLGKWMRVAYGYNESQNLKVCRFGDNMREVAVTEGDKVEAQIKFGWQVNTWPVFEVVEEMAKISNKEVDKLMNQYKKEYKIGTKKLQNIRTQAREELAIRRILDRNGAKGLVTTFQDLCGMPQLPGLAAQHLMGQGYGFGAEGDWKLCCLTRVIKAMTKGMPGGTTFMEDYSYNMAKGEEWELGAHMLEICPSIAANKPTIITKPLGIGKNPEDPARLVFDSKTGKATATTLVDMGNKFRIICQDIELIKAPLKMPNLPVAKVVWKMQPSLKDGIKFWILAGGAHHNTLSLDADAEMIRDWAEMCGVEYVHIGKETTYESLKMQLDLFDRK